MAAVQFEAWPYSGAGNRFLLVDARGGADERLAPDALGSLVRRMQEHEFDPDGLLLLESTREADARLTILNRDGTRALACGNGLRCVGLHLAAGGSRTPQPFVVATDAGPRRVEFLGDDSARSPGPARIRAEIGPARLVQAQARVAVGKRRVVGAHVDVGNPHLVLFVEDAEAQEVSELGPALSAHPRFEGGINVGFAQRLAAGGFALRVFERGVGETEACGTGAAAAAFASGDAFPLEVALRGGVLRVEQGGDGVLWIVGPARKHGPL